MIIVYQCYSVYFNTFFGKVRTKKSNTNLNSLFYMIIKFDELLIQTDMDNVLSLRVWERVYNKLNLA